MNNNFGSADWKKYIPMPVCDEYPGFNDLYMKAWELAFDHIKYIPGMPQNPYMDEAFCDTQVWIWDSCFMSFFCKYARPVFPGVETLNNFYEVLYGEKRLPKVLTPDNEPDWTGAVPGTTFEIKVHIADNPPLFAWAEYENALFSGDKEYIKTLLYDRQFLQKHYDWMESLKESVMLDTLCNPTHLIAEKYGYKWEGGSSGMDNTPRGRTGEHAEGQRPNNPHMLWVDAICQQALSAKMISKLFTIIDDSENANYWNEKHKEKKLIVNELYWDNTDRFYYDIDCNNHKFYKIMSIASYWTLISEIAPEERADDIVKKLVDPNLFSGSTSFLSLSRSDNDYSGKGTYWRGSVWIPTAYMTLRGLTKYGYFDAAHSESLKLLTHMYRTYAEFEPHTIWECYSPEGNRPATTEHGTDDLVRKDFCGWSALGPIAIYIENVLGFYDTNAFTKTVKWARPKGLNGKYGIKNYSFGNIVTDIIADGDVCYITSNDNYTLEVDDKVFNITSGQNKIEL